MFAIGGTVNNEIKNALRGVFKDAEHISIAVSYIQLSGWKVLDEILGSFDRSKIRVVCTDQLGITDPKAVKLAISQGVNIRNFAGNQTFHPKLYLTSSKSRGTPYMLGSSNLSYSALCRSFEVNALGNDDGALLSWFDDLFSNKSNEFDQDKLDEMARTIARRLKAQVWIQKTSKKDTIQKEAISSELLDPLFGDLGVKVATLNFDQAANNIRNLQLALDVVKASKWNSKQKSELKLLGITTDGRLNSLGKSVAVAEDINEFARIWVAWLKNASIADLEKTGNYRLQLLKNAIERFWMLPKDVSDYFLTHSENPTKDQKKTLQTIELLSNVGETATKMTLNEVEALTGLVKHNMGLPSETKSAIDDYLKNKGPRGWSEPDRRILLQAWKK